MDDSTPLKVYVVEDEALISMEIEDRLIQFGYEVAGTAAEGEVALKEIPDLKPDIVMMDINLAGELDGIQVATQLHEQHDIPVVFLSAFSDESLLKRAKKAEPYGYLVKPFEGAELRATLEMALYKHQMEKERAALTRKLQAALDEIEVLQNLIPLCAWCRRIRDDDGYWTKLEDYVQKRFNATVTHGICTECAEKMVQDGLEDHG